MKKRILIFLFSILATFSSVLRAGCHPSDAIKPFKEELEKDYFNGREISFNLLINGPQLTSGKYYFVADNAKWSGPVVLDLQNCSMKTDGNWVMWRTVNSEGNW